MRLRRANVHMFAGQAGTFKTMVTMNAVANMKVDTLYFSNDSDDTTASSRLLSMATGVPTATTEEWLGSEERLEYCAGVLAKHYSHVSWQFNNSPSLDDIWLEMYAYAEVHGVYPELVVVDILMNVAHAEGDEWATMRAVMREMQTMARETKAAILVIHHVSEGASTKPCPSRREILGKGAVREVLMVTFGVDEQQRLYAACVKNRFGKSDLHAKDPFEMGINPSIATVYGLPVARQPEGKWW